jgi:hypothetical protein
LLFLVWTSTWGVPWFGQVYQLKKKKKTTIGELASDVQQPVETGASKEEEAYVLCGNDDEYDDMLDKKDCFQESPRWSPIISLTR